MTKTFEPIFSHDCDCCTFLGTFKNHDLYHCFQGGIRPTVIARYGNDGPDYTSGIVFASVNEHIGEGVRLAKEMNLSVDI